MDKTGIATLGRGKGVAFHIELDGLQRFYQCSQPSHIIRANMALVRAGANNAIGTIGDTNFGMFHHIG